MAQPYVTGPVHIYVGTSAPPPIDPFAGGIQPVYLGTCEAAPKVRFNPQYEPLMNDVTGSRLPYDYLYQGKDGQVFGDLTIWNYTVLRQIHAKPNWAKVDEGLEDELEVGTLMMTEGFVYPLWLHFPYASKPAFGPNGMPAGYHFFGAFLFGPDDLDPGTKANKVHVQFQCHRLMDKSTGKKRLFNLDMTGVPAVPPASPLGQ